MDELSSKQRMLLLAEVQRILERQSYKESALFESRMVVGGEKMMKVELYEQIF